MDEARDQQQISILYCPITATAAVAAAVTTAAAVAGTTVISATHYRCRFLVDCCLLPPSPMPMFLPLLP
jgi:hypothetical protein